MVPGGEGWDSDDIAGSFAVGARFAVEGSLEDGAADGSVLPGGFFF